MSRFPPAKFLFSIHCFYNLNSTARLTPGFVSRIRINYRIKRCVGRSTRERERENLTRFVQELWSYIRFFFHAARC